MNISSTEQTKNADRFTGFSDVYDSSRPKLPDFPVAIALKYLGRPADLVVDLGCGTGLSTLIWQDKCKKAIGVEPNDDMRRVAQGKANAVISFIDGFSHATNLGSASADVVMCSQSFHWMEPVSTLAEVNRVLKHGGVFAAVDCDWPPVSDWRVEKAYTELFDKAYEIEKTHPEVRDSFIRYAKKHHLDNIKNSGYFRFVREIVFSNTEKCTTKRLYNLALSQGSLQGILKREPTLVSAQAEAFGELVGDVFGEREFEIIFSYRMRIGVK